MTSLIIIAMNVKARHQDKYHKSHPYQQHQWYPEHKHHLYNGSAVVSNDKNASSIPLMLLKWMGLMVLMLMKNVLTFMTRMMILMMILTMILRMILRIIRMMILLMILMMVGAGTCMLSKFLAAVPGSLAIGI